MKTRRMLPLGLFLVAAFAACKPQMPDVPPPPAADELWWNERIFYELFVRSYQDSDGDGIGDLAGLIERLNYLNDGDPRTADDLGVTGLWLMPIMESPSYHGYDVVDYRAVERDYGDAAAFRILVDEAHDRGMVVLVDLVINHTSSQHPWFLDTTNPQSERRDWYVWSDDQPGYSGPWGQPVWHLRGDDYYYGIFWSGMPDLNYRTPAVTTEIQEVTRFWLETMGVDGFRMDAVRHLIENGAEQADTTETHRWLRDYRAFYKSVKPEAMTVGEVWTRTEDVVPYVGDELDICFEFDLAGAILSSARGGYASTIASVMAKVDDLYPPQQYATFLTNHDHERAMSQLGEDEGRAKIAASIYLTLPGVPFIYYGEEIGMTGRKPDERLRTPMQWSGESGAGFTAGRPWQPVNGDYRTKNVAAQMEDEDSLLNHYKWLIRLRSTYGALRTGDLLPLLSDSLSVYAYIRHGEDEDILVIHNLSAEAQTDYALTLQASALAPGAYRVRDLLDEAKGVRLEVDDKGGFNDYIPFPALEPHQTRILLVDR